jgi:hypothetical protein
MRRNKFEFMYQLHVSTETIDGWWYYEFEDYIKLLNERNEEEKRRREAEEKKSQGGAPSMSQMKFNPSNFRLPSVPKL